MASVLSALSLEAYLDLQEVLQKGGSTVGQVSQIEEAGLVKNDVSRLLAVHGLTEGSRKKRDVLDAMKGMHTLAPIASWPPPPIPSQAQATTDSVPGTSAAKAPEPGPAGASSGSKTGPASTSSAAPFKKLGQPQQLVFKRAPLSLPAAGAGPTPAQGQPQENAIHSPLQTLGAADLMALNWFPGDSQVWCASENTRCYDGLREISTDQCGCAKLHAHDGRMRLPCVRMQHDVLCSCFH